MRTSDSDPLGVLPRGLRVMAMVFVVATHLPIEATGQEREREIGLPPPPTRTGLVLGLGWSDEPATTLEVGIASQKFLDPGGMLSLFFEGGADRRSLTYDLAWHGNGQPSDTTFTYTLYAGGGVQISFGSGEYRPFMRGTVGGARYDWTEFEGGSAKMGWYARPTIGVVRRPTSGKSVALGLSYILYGFEVELPEAVEPGAIRVGAPRSVNAVRFSIAILVL